MAYHPNELVYTSGPQARAWHRYYESMRDDPESDADQRQRATGMLSKFPIPEQYKAPMRAEDLA